MKIRCHISKDGKEYLTLRDRISNIINELLDKFEDFVSWYDSLDKEHPYL